jgi:hypothetical protein
MTSSNNLLCMSVNWEKIYFIFISGESETHHISILHIIILSSGFGKPQESRSYRHVCQLSILNPLNLKFNNSLLVQMKCTSANNITFY